MAFPRTSNSRCGCPDIIRGIEYLSVRAIGDEWKVGERVIVVGGGNVAYDCARTTVRNNAKKVHMVCLESRDEQTADEFEIEDGFDERKYGPQSPCPDLSRERFLRKVVGLRVQEISSLFDYTGRFAPQMVPNAQFVIPCDTIILAIGQIWT